MLNLRLPELEPQLQPRIAVVGVGGAGGNAVNNMIKSNLLGVEFLVANTDAQALALNSAERKLQLGAASTRGLGAGAKPEVGKIAAEEAIDEIRAYLDGAHMAFVTAGMGGGTGTGAAPVVARLARELGILTVGVVTKPFSFEGTKRMRQAEAGIQELQQYVDTLIIIPNQKLFHVATEKTSFVDAFKMADEVLHAGVRGITDLIVMPGLINLDFADVRTVMSEMGKAMMGTGEAQGERRALDAAQAAISNPLLDEVSMKGARALLINITGGTDIGIHEVDEAVNHIAAEVDPDANIIFGSTFNPDMEGRIRVSVVATGIDAGTRIVTPTIFAPIANAHGFKQAEAPVAASAQSAALDIPETVAPVAATAPALPVMEPVLPPRATQSEDGGIFIPPAPVDAGQRPITSRVAPTIAASRQPEPQEVRRKPGFSLFGKMTGRKDEVAPPPAPRGTPNLGGGHGNHSGGGTPSAYAYPASPQQSGGQGGGQAAARQPSLDTQPRPRTAPLEDDMLDIPAFLRRQAN